MATPKVRHVKHYDRERSWYDIPDGRIFPGVTNVLGARAKEALIYWAAKQERVLVMDVAASLWEDAPVDPKMSRMAFTTTLTNRLPKARAHQRELTQASEIGKSLHALIEWNLRRDLGQVVGPEPHVKDAAAWAFMVWEKWRQRINLKPRLIEQVVWSNTHEYAGTLDLVAECTLPGLGEVLVVVDWKTSKALYGESLLQNTAYVHAIIEMGHLEAPVHGLIVRLPKVETDPEPELLPIPWETLEALYPQFLALKKVWDGMEKEAELMDRLRGMIKVEDVAGVPVMVGSKGENTSPAPAAAVVEHVTGAPDAIVNTKESEDGSLGGATIAPVPVTVVEDDGSALHTGEDAEPTGAGPSLPSSPKRRLPGYQRSLVEYLQKAGKGDLLKESEDGDLFLWLPVNVLKILKFAKADEPLPVTLSELSVTEATGIMRAFMEVAKG